MLEKILGKENSDVTHEEQEEIARGVTGLGFAGNPTTVRFVLFCLPTVFDLSAAADTVSIVKS